MTPTPWACDGDRGVIYGIAPADNGEVPICQLLHDSTDCHDADRCAEDAALILAAPALVAALELLMSDVEGSVDYGMPFEDERHGFHESMKAARAAWAAAKGVRS